MSDTNIAEGITTGSGDALAGNATRRKHTVFGSSWALEVEEAVRQLGEGHGTEVVVIVSVNKNME
jgi:hypothetical protein